MGYYQITLPKFYMFPIKCKMHYAYLENCVAVIWLAVYPIYFTVFWLFIFWTDIQVAPYDKA